MAKCVSALIWAGVILLGACVSNFLGLVHTQTVHFRWIDQPQFAQLFFLPKSIDYSYIIQKCGHIMAFFILAAISPLRPLKTLLWGSVFAFATEVLQIFVGRSGRFLDVGYDIAGLILGAIMFLTFFQSRKIPENITLKK